MVQVASSIAQLSPLHGLPFWADLVIGAVAPILVGVFGWLAKRAEASGLSSTASEVQTVKVIDTLHSELTRAYALLQALQPQVDLLAQARFRLLDVVSEVYGAAIAGRTMVHDLERRLGLAETQFLPLPQIPLSGLSVATATAVPAVAEAPLNTAG